MSISRRIARPLLASIFIAEGWDAIRNPDGKGKTAEALSQLPSTEGPVVPEDSLNLVRLNGVVQISGGALLAIGKFPRLAALALIGSIVPTTYAGHRFWHETDEEIRAQQKIQLLKNLGLLGGLIFAAVDTEGAPSIAWRTRRRVRRVAGAVSAGRPDADGHMHQATSRAADMSRDAGRRAKKAAKVASHRANAAADGVARQANEMASNTAKAGAAIASPYIRHANEGTLEAAEGALEVAGPYISAGIERAGELLEGALDVASPYISAGFERAGELLSRAPEHFPTD
jgi:uncharacterized membrane protein YphA (DoxX/SURF4 family)